jgi:two-component system, OmpR family, copper resistance phosphate regulon response regulator CusR
MHNFVYRLLLIEDEEKLTATLQRQLHREGFEVSVSYDGLTAREMISSGVYHLIILDLNLPGISGTELLEYMRKTGDRTPVLILSARDKIEDKLQGFNIGADDYLVKPFDINELVARIKAILYRAGFRQVTKLKAGDLVMDLINRTVKRADKEINLSPKEFSLLEFLMKNKNQVITGKRIAEQVWGYTFETGTNIVNVYVNYLRKNIDNNHNKKLLVTIRGQGFILVDKE